MILHRAAEVLGCDPDRFRQSRRIPEADKECRDVLIYVLWETGKYTNREIGELFGLTYSSISRRVEISKERLKDNETFNQSQ
ncbi:MAG: hypothetical protein ABII68_04665 [Pseudomonadota bacterium]